MRLRKNHFSFLHRWLRARGASSRVLFLSLFHSDAIVIDDSPRSRAATAGRSRERDRESGKQLPVSVSSPANVVVRDDAAPDAAAAAADVASLRLGLTSRRSRCDFFRWIGAAESASSLSIVLACIEIDHDAKQGAERERERYGRKAQSTKFKKKLRQLRPPPPPPPSLQRRPSSRPPRPPPLLLLLLLHRTPSARSRRESASSAPPSPPSESPCCGATSRASTSCSPSRGGSPRWTRRRCWAP